jgi:hypothetical protein
MSAPSMHCRVPHPVTLTRHSWGGCELTAARDALEAHPLCPAGLFDGYGTRWKASRTVIHNGRKHRLRARGHRFQLLIYPTRAEAAAQRQRDRAAWGMQNAAADAQRRLAQLATSSSEWRTEALARLRLWAGSIEITGGGHAGGGFALDQDAQALVGIHLQAIRQVFETARVVFDPDAKHAEVQRIMEPLREQCPEVQSFLQRVQGGAQ